MSTVSTRVLGIDLMDLTPNKRCLRKESEDDVGRTASCCSDSNDTDNDDSAGSVRPTNIPQKYFCV